MLKIILIGLATSLCAFLALVATRPDKFHVERSAEVKAPPEVLYGEVADFHAWEAWSPWGKLDPAMKLTYGGPSSGEGAHYAWVGNDEVGEGAMTITHAAPSESVDIKLEFLKPFAATNATRFVFKKGAAGTTSVVWSMDGDNNFMAKAMCLFMNMDKMVGGDFDRGLAQLKSVAEAKASAPPASALAPPCAAPPDSPAGKAAAAAAADTGTKK